jgi:rare lipoprotein A
MRVHLGLLLLLGCWTSSAGAAAEVPAPPDGEAVVRQASAAKPRLDHSGKKRRGKASYYGRKFYGKRMAKGRR